MKTAMQQMIDILQRQINHLKTTQEKQGLSDFAKGALFTLHSRLIDAEELLEVEKEQISEAYTLGHCLHDSNDENSAQDYYQKTYKSDE